VRLHEWVPGVLQALCVPLHTPLPHIVMNSLAVLALGPGVAEFLQYSLRPAPGVSTSLPRTHTHPHPPAPPHACPAYSTGHGAQGACAQGSGHAGVE
jgi:hypothetical protein